jgi:hypothetical protein
MPCENVFFCRVSWAASEENTRGFELVKYVSQNCVMKCPDVIAIGPCHRSVSVAECISHHPGAVGVVPPFSSFFDVPGMKMNFHKSFAFERYHFVDRSALFTSSFVVTATS